MCNMDKKERKIITSAKRLQIIRNYFGLTQKDFANLLGIGTQNTYSRYENGINEFNDKLKILLISVIQKKYGKRISLDWLLTGEEEMFIENSNQEEPSKFTIPLNDGVSDQLSDLEENISFEKRIEDLANEIKMVRRKMGKSQKEIAALLGIPQTTWSNYEIGKAKPPLKILMQLADLGYAIPGFSNNVILGNNNTQIGNNNQIVQKPDNSTPQYPSDEYAELLDLLCNYAPPKMLKELKAKLLKIKEMADNAPV